MQGTTASILSKLTVEAAPLPGLLVLVPSDLGLCAYRAEHLLPVNSLLEPLDAVRVREQEVREGEEMLLRRVDVEAFVVDHRPRAVLSVLLDDVRLEEPEVELRRRTVENVAQRRLLRLLVRRYMAALSPSRGKRAEVEAPLTLDLMTRKIPNQSSRNLTREKARVSMSKKTPNFKAIIN